MQCDIVILGAGKPVSGETPAALRRTAVGEVSLRWMLHSLAPVAGQTTFVAGFGAEAVQAQAGLAGLSIVENPDWQETGSAASLLQAPTRPGQPLLAVYGDILFRRELIERLLTSDAPVTVVHDSLWRQHRRPGAPRRPEDCERLTLVGALAGALEGGAQDGAQDGGHEIARVARLGTDIPVDWAQGEFVGIVLFRAEAADWLRANRQALSGALRRAQLSDLVEAMRLQGHRIGALDVQGDWAEVDQDRDVARFVLGTKAETLARLRGLVTRSVIEDQVSFTVAGWQAEPKAIIARIRSYFAGRPILVRSSAKSEDSFSSANAGAYQSILNLDPAGDLAGPIGQVIASYHAVQPEDQVLVQPMVTDVAMSGVAFTRTLEHAAPWYVINYETSGGTDGITSGASTSHETLMLRRDAPAAQAGDPRLVALVESLREIEAILGYDGLDVEFAIGSGGVVHILQIRPIAVRREAAGPGDAALLGALDAAHATFRRLGPTPPHYPAAAPPVFGVMPDWNPAEIIGTAPGALADSLYRFLIMDRTWARQRAEYGYRDMRPSPLLVSFAGRPYVDVRASFASFIPASLPDDLGGRLHNFYLGWLQAHPELHDKVEFEVVPTCLTPNFAYWEERLGREGGFAPAEIAALRDALGAITAAALDRCAGDLARISALSARFDALALRTDLHPLERARLLLEDCRSYGTLPFAHLARSGFVAVSLLRGAVETGVIDQPAREAFMASLRTVSHAFSTDAEAVRQGGLDWEAFVARYGHLRPGTYDITSLRYDADVERYLRPLITAETSEAHAALPIGPWEDARQAFMAAMERIGLGSDTDRIERFLRDAIEGREYAKFVFSRNLSAAIETLAEYGAELGLERVQVANLPLARLLALRDDAPGVGRPDALAREAARNAEARRMAAMIELPALIAQESDLDGFVIGTDVPNFVGSRGVTGDVLRLDGDARIEPGMLQGRIVFAPQADPGYDWLFGQAIGGLITQYGGANSHMAIRAAEFDLPAAIGVGEKLYRELSGGKVVELDPVSRILRVIR